MTTRLKILHGKSPVPICTSDWAADALSQTCLQLPTRLRCPKINPEGNRGLSVAWCFLSFQQPADVGAFCCLSIGQPQSSA